jgi:DSBA-like thioredoxin domain
VNKDPTMPRLTFWYEFASTYSYLSAMRIEAAAAAADVEVVWQPFLLGPIFQAQGWTTSPFNIYPAKGHYMVRDVGRMAAARGLKFHMPDPFPANALKAVRLAIIGAAHAYSLSPPGARLGNPSQHRRHLRRGPILLGRGHQSRQDEETAFGLRWPRRERLRGQGRVLLAQGRPDEEWQDAQGALPD